VTGPDLAAAVEALPHGVALVDGDGAVRTWNAEMARLTGRSAHRAVGRPVPFALPEPGAVLGVRAGARWLEVSVAPAGEGAVVSARDVTASRLLEESQELFLATASHELRTPLTVLRGFGQTLLRHWDVLDDARRVELVQRMLDRSDEMAGLVEQLLAASAAGVATAAASPERFDLAGAVREAVERSAGSSDHPVAVDAPDPCWALGRPEAVAPVLDQLLENAVKYCPAGTPVEVTVEAQDGGAVLRVADRGPGLADGERERVFERFVRGSAAAPGSSGAGLGLWIVRRTVEAQQGRVVALAREGGGTVVEVRLPAG
jgi:two-component system, NtrC family, sensor histidine kinase KinB